MDSFHLSSVMFRIGLLSTKGLHCLPDYALLTESERSNLRGSIPRHDWSDWCLELSAFGLTFVLCIPLLWWYPQFVGSTLVVGGANVVYVMRLRENYKLAKVLFLRRQSEH